MYFTTYCNQNKRLSQANPPIKTRSILKERERERERKKQKEKDRDVYSISLKLFQKFIRLSRAISLSCKFNYIIIILTSINENVLIAVQKDKQDIVNGMGLAKKSTV